MFFGTLKIATHLAPLEGNRNEYERLPKYPFLIGNLISAALAILYTGFYSLWEVSWG